MEERARTEVEKIRWACCHVPGLDLSGCLLDFVVIDGFEVKRRVYHPDDALPGDVKLIVCHECSTTAGGAHHVACSREICPRCSERLQVCSCTSNGEVRNQKIFTRSFSIDQNTRPLSGGLSRARHNAIYKPKAKAKRKATTWNDKTGRIDLGRSKKKRKKS